MVNNISLVKTSKDHPAKYHNVEVCYNNTSKARRDKRGAVLAMRFHKKYQRAVLEKRRFHGIAGMTSKLPFAAEGL